MFEVVEGEGDADATPRISSPGVIFHPATGIDATPVAPVQTTLQKRILRAFVTRGLLENCDAKDMLGYKHSGFSVDAGVCIEAHDRAALERLLRYCARPPFSMMIAATLLLALLVQVQFGLRPFQRLAATVERIRRGEDIRFGSESLPHEIVPLAAQIDVLLDEHAVRVQRARHAAQDLAHALKTPLAVLTMECERPRPDMAVRVADQVARMQVAITHHLAGASAADRRQRTAITPVVDGLLDAMRRIHAARGIAFSADIADEAVFAGSVEDLEEMLGNLLDNAGKWARTQVRIASAQTTDHHLLVSIEDDGPGMDEAAVQRALQRGVRLDERIPGSGLGLDIVEGMTRNHDGEMLIDRSALGGLRVRLRFPAAD